MSSWFGKHDFQGVVSDSNGMGSASDRTNATRNKTMFSTIRNKVATGVKKTKNVTIGADGTLTSVSSHALHLQLTKGQFAYYQDCSFADVSNTLFSTYTDVFNPDPCIPQVVQAADFADNTDLSNAYVGTKLLDGSCIVLDSSCANVQYAEIKQVASGGAEVDVSATLLELNRKQAKMMYPGPVQFTDVCT